MSDCKNLKKNIDICPCGNENCPRRGTCCECIAAHLAGESVPMCMRDLLAKKIAEAGK